MVSSGLVYRCICYCAKEILPWRLVLGAYSFPWEFDGEKAHYVFLDALITADLRGSSANLCVIPFDKDVNAYEKIVLFFDLNKTYSDFYEKALGDPLLSEFARKYMGWRPRLTSLWWATIIGICQQNTGFIQGWKMLASIIKLYGRKTVIGNTTIPIPPAPLDVLKQPDLLVKARTGYRAETIIRVANLFVEKDEDDIGYDELIAVKGIGKYTASLALVLARREYWRAPIDRWLRKIVSHVYRVDEKHADRVYHEIWGDYQGLAALATTIALDAVPLRKALERIDNGILVPTIIDKPTPANMWKFTNYW